MTNIMISLSLSQQLFSFLWKLDAIVLFEKRQ